MLERIGAASIDDLFDEIDPALAGADFTTLEDSVDEMTMLAQLAERAAQDETGPCFLGAGCYDHHIPAAVWDIASRGEFMTAYTPYQAEASQGTLQLIYEYQTMMTALTGMEVSNASVYDGGSALAEAVLMAMRASRRRRNARSGVAVAGACHPLYLETAANIVGRQGIRLAPTGYLDDGSADLDALAAMQPAAVIVQQPNFFGVLEPVDAIARWAAENDVLLVAVANPMSLALLKPPGEWGDAGADIVCGDGQPLGVPMASGGPSFGFICTRMSLVRQLPGRIVGRTADRNGEAGYTLTLQAREQHIRRGKATSNICTNQGLLVTAATIHMALLGRAGLRRVAESCHRKAEQLVQALTSIDGVGRRFAAPFFHECVIDLGQPAQAVLSEVAGSGIVGGLALGPMYPELASCVLVCATEKRTDRDIEACRSAFQAALRR